MTLGLPSRKATVTVRGADVAVLETQPEGHRLQYLSHIVAAAGADQSLVITSAAAARSAEFEAYVAGDVRTTMLPEDDPRGVLGAAVEVAVEAGVSRLVVPDGDHHLLPLLRLVTRRPRLPLSITLLLMRTTEIGGPERLRPATLVKPAAVQLLRPFRRVRVLFLTDALGVVTRRRGFIGTSGVPDPVALPPEPVEHARPAWMPAAEQGRTRIGVFGVVDARKNVPLLIDALRVDPTLRLVIGGRVRPEVRSFLDADPGVAALTERITVMDRLLDPDEFAAALTHVDVAMALHDNDAPSGIVAESCLRGTPVVVPERGWLARVVTTTGIGVTSVLDGPAVAAAVARIAADPDLFVGATRRHATRLGSAAFTDALLAR